MTKKTGPQGMRRRDFLKLAGTGLAAVGTLPASTPLLASWFLAPQTAFGDTLLRGTQNGQILQSPDEGQTWRPVFSFGSHCSVCNLVTQNGQVYARLAVSGHAFWVCTSDAKTWRTLS